MPNIDTALTLKDLPPPPPGKSGWPWTEQSFTLPEQMPNGSKWPRLSIVTPSYNQGEFIEATIRSVLLQGYSNLEYIVIDGGSSDHSVEIIKKYESYLFHWSSEKDRGQSDAINKGIIRSNGELLGWINSDDVYVRGAFYKVAKAFHFHPDSIVVHGDRILIDKVGDVTGWACLPKFDPTTLIYNVCSETAFWRRSAMDEAGLLNVNLKFAIDLEFFGRLYQYGKFLKMNEYLGYFRCHNESKSSTIARIGQEEAQTEWKKLFGSTNRNYNCKRKASLLEKSLVLLNHPTLIGLPYLLHRFTKLTRGICIS